MLPCIKREREAQWLPSLRRTMVIWSPGAAGRGLQFYACASARGIGDISSTESGFKSSISSASHMTKSAMAVSSEARVTEAPMAVRAGTVNRTVTGSSPVAGAIRKIPLETRGFFHFQRLLAFLATLHVYPSAEAVARPAVHAYDERTGSIKQRKEVHHVHWRSFLRRRGKHVFRP